MVRQRWILMLELARVYGEDGREGLAAFFLDEVLHDVTTLAREDPRMETEGDTLFQVQVELGRACQRLEQHGPARGWYECALLLEGSELPKRTDAEHVHGLARAWHGLANASGARGEFDRAASLAREAQAHESRALALAPDHPVYAAELATMRATEARAVAACRR